VFGKITFREGLKLYRQSQTGYYLLHCTTSSATCYKTSPPSTQWNTHPTPHNNTDTPHYSTGTGTSKETPPSSRSGRPPHPASIRYRGGSCSSTTALFSTSALRTCLGVSIMRSSIRENQIVSAYIIKFSGKRSDRVQRSHVFCFYALCYSICDERYWKLRASSGGGTNARLKNPWH